MGARPRLVRRWTVVDGTPVHSRETPWGTRPGASPLVLVHGLAISSRYFVPLLHACAGAGIPAVAPDLPGIGATPRRGGTGDVAGMTRVLARWIGARGFGPVPALGNSLGAQVAVELAAVRPDLVPALVLVGPTVDPGRRSGTGQLGALLRDVPREHPSLPPAVVAETLHTDPRLLRDRSRSALAHPVADRLAAAGARTLVIRGTDDPLVSPAWARHLAELSAGELVTVPGGHAVHHARPGLVLRATDAFLAATTS